MCGSALSGLGSAAGTLSGEFRPRRTGRLFVTLTQTTALRGVFSIKSALWWAWSQLARYAFPSVNRASSRRPAHCLPNLTSSRTGRCSTLHPPVDGNFRKGVVASTSDKFKTPLTSSERPLHEQASISGRGSRRASGRRAERFHRAHEACRTRWFRRERQPGGLAGAQPR